MSCGWTPGSPFPDSGEVKKKESQTCCDPYSVWGEAHWERGEAVWTRTEAALAKGQALCQHLTTDRGKHLTLCSWLSWQGKEAADPGEQSTWGADGSKRGFTQTESKGERRGRKDSPLAGIGRWSGETQGNISRHHLRMPGPKSLGFPPIYDPWDIPALFEKGKRWKQSKCPLTDDE